MFIVSKSVSVHVFYKLCSFHFTQECTIIIYIISRFTDTMWRVLYRDRLCRYMLHMSLDKSKQHN